MGAAFIRKVVLTHDVSVSTTLWMIVTSTQGDYVVFHTRIQNTMPSMG